MFKPILIIIIINFLYIKIRYKYYKKIVKYFKNKIEKK